jgi:hypothetical protein
MLFRF